MIVNCLNVFVGKKLSKKETALVGCALSDIAKHLTNAAECIKYSADRKYHFKLAYKAFEACPVEYALTEQAWHVVDYESFCDFIEHISETSKSFKLMSRADRQLLFNLLTDAINLSFRWLKPSNAAMEGIIDLHGNRIAKANVVPFNKVKEAA